MKRCNREKRVILLKKILHVIPYMHHSAGGPPVVVEKFAELAPARGWESSLVTTTLLCNGDEEELERSLVSRFPAKVLRVDRPRARGLSSEAVSVLDREIGAADLVHVHTLWHPLTGMVRRTCHKYGKPYIVMPHGMLDPYSMRVKGLKKRLYMFLLEKRNLLSARRIVYTTAEEMRLACTTFPWLPQGVVVPLGSEPPPDTKREALAESFLSCYPQLSGKRLLLFLSRLHPKKGLDRLLAAFRQVVAIHRDVALVIAGDGECGYVESLKNQVRTNGLASSVYFAGTLAGDTKWGAFAAAEIFILPSRQENFALVVAEAMHMGVPVIMTDKVNTWPYIARANAGLVLSEKNIVMELEKGIALLLGNRALGAEMGTRGREMAKRELTWPGSVAAMVSCYDDLTRACP